MSKKMFSRERERGKLRFSALLILIGLLLFGCDPTMVTITYNANGGEGEMKPQAVESGVEVKLIANAFTKAGSDFTGWNEAADGSGKAYADGATVAPTGNLTLYAQWQAKPAEEPEQPGEVTDPDEPGGEVTDPEQPEDPPVSLENHITNTAFIAAVEAVYPSIGWSKTEDGYVDMTVEANQTAVTGVESLDLSGQGLTSSEGLEYFTGLKQLTLSASKDGSDKQNALTELDVSALTALTSLVLDGNPLTALPDLTNQSALVSLNAASCGLTAVSGLPASLMILNLSDNELTALDVSALTNLASLLCYRNQMNALDITTLSSLNELYCGAQKTEGDLSLNATSEQLESLRNLFEGNVEDNAFLLLNSDVVWIVPAKDFDLTAGTAVFNKTTGLTLSFSGSTLPENASASVSLDGTQVDSQFNSDRTAVIVALAALTNDTVDMTVTVTVSAEGYNNAVLPYEGVSTVWMPENVTAALADSEAKIGGETVTVTVSQTDGSDSLDAVRILSGTYSNGTSAALAIGGDGRSFTAPVLESAAETGTTVTVTLVLGKENAAGSDTVTADNLSLTVYPSTHVRFNNNVFALVKGFDFKDSSALGEDVKYKEGNSGSEGEVPSENITDDGFTFTAVKSNGKNEVSLPTTDLGTADLTMFDLKWNDSENANVYVMQGEVGQNKDGWGFSVYKKAEQGTGSFLLGGNTTPWQPKTGALWSYTALADTFDQYFIYDNGSSAPVFGRGSTDKVYTVTNDLSNDEKFSAASPFKIFFEVTNDNASVEYTLRAVNFYKSLGSSN